MYRLYQFGSTVLPDAMSSYEAGTPTAWNGAVALPGGGTALDTLGTAAARLQTPYELRYKASLTAASLAALETSLAGWRALVGTRAALQRKALGSAAYQWVWARLMSLDMDTKPPHSMTRVQPVEWRFQVLDEYWRSLLTQSDSFTLNATPRSCAVGNSGNAPVRDMVVTFTPVGSSFTALDVAIAGVAHWTYTGAIPVGNAITVDCGSRRIYDKNGVDLYSGFALQSDHASEDWLPLAANATTTISVTRTGGATTSTVEFVRYYKYV